jgi:MinD-like ATPase involved in chromosome partitioning or flagellar assembly/CheY-like chemotaxis protein
MRVFIFDEYQDDVNHLKESIIPLVEYAEGYADFNIAVERLGQQKPDILVININLISRIKELNISLKDIYILVIADFPEPEYLQLCLSIGALDLLIKPLQYTDIKNAIDKARKTLQARYTTVSPLAIKRPRFGRVISFFSIEQGIGQSLMASNLAACLTLQTAKVLFVSLEANFLEKQQSLFHLAQIAAENYYLLYKNEYLDVLVPKTDSGFSEEQVFSLISKMKKNYDYIILDLAKQISGSTMIALNFSEVIVYLITLDRAFLTKIIENFRQLNHFNIQNDRIFTVINEKNELPTISKKELEETLPINCFIPKDAYTIEEAVKKQEPFAIAFSAALISQKVHALGKSIIEKLS